MFFGGAQKIEMPKIYSSLPQKKCLVKLADFPNGCPINRNLRATKNLLNMDVQDKILLLYTLLMQMQETSRQNLEESLQELQDLLKCRDDLEVMLRAEQMQNIKVCSQLLLVLNAMSSGSSNLNFTYLFSRFLFFPTVFFVIFSLYSI